MAKKSGLLVFPEAWQETVVSIWGRRAGDQSLGSGFIVEHGAKRYVVTCRHVHESVSSGDEVLVNGLPASSIGPAALDVDLAMMHCPASLVGLPALMVSPTPLQFAARPRIAGFGFRRLDRLTSVGERYAGTVQRGVEFRGFTSAHRITGWEFCVDGDESERLSRGNSGSPIIDASNKVRGVLVHASTDGRIGSAIDASVLRAAWPAEFAAIGNVQALPEPPEPPPYRISHPDDFRKGMFEGQSEVDGRRLRTELSGEPLKRYFYFNAVIESTDGTPLEGPARFFLHDTYARSVVWIRNVEKDGKEILLKDYDSYGVFTIGAQVRAASGAWVGLEVDLAGTPDLPDRFKSL